NKGNQLATGQQFRNSYTKLFPTAFFNYKLAEKHDVGLSMSRRLDRPSYRQLNPFKFFINSSTYSEGNPYLQPQFTWAYEMSYTYNQKLTATLSYSVTTDNITEVIFPATGLDKITIQANRNLNSFTYYGLNLSAPVTVAKWWNSFNNMDIYYGRYEGSLSNTTLRNGTVNFNINSNNSLGSYQLSANEITCTGALPGVSAACRIITATSSLNLTADDAALVNEMWTSLGALRTGTTGSAFAISCSRVVYPGATAKCTLNFAR
ncbi:MAG: hypothetical protein EOP48_23265, partial [Sphingobacteriales bacterium]